MTLVILSCATPSLGAYVSCWSVLMINNSLFYLISVWWPFFVVIFYFLAPVPVLFANRYSETLQMSTSTTPKDVALFFTAGIVISAYGLPIILARAPILEPVVCIWFYRFANIDIITIQILFRFTLERVHWCWWAIPWYFSPFLGFSTLSARKTTQADTFKLMQPLCGYHFALAESVSHSHFRVP